MEISKRKKKEFDDIFKLISNNDFYIDVELFRNLFISDFYEHFLIYVQNKISDLLKTTDIISIHININLMLIKDTYHYDKIIKFSEILHIYSKNIKKIFVYGTSSFFGNLINLINISLGMNINEKIIFTNDFDKINSNKINLSI